MSALMIAASRGFSDVGVELMKGGANLKCVDKVRPSHSNGIGMYVWMYEIVW
jgi:hypothetical protein